MSTAEVQAAANLRVEPTLAQVLTHLRETLLSRLPFKEKYDRIKNYMLPVPWAVEHWRE